MSLPSNRPYKSRFFNFLNRYSIRLKDQAGVAWRNAAQTTVEWGVQILLYPVYLVVQAGRFAQRQLKQAVRNVPRLIASRLKKEPTAQPIDLLLPTERVLDALHPTVSRVETPSGYLFPRFDLHLINPKNPFSSLQEASSLAVSESDSSLVTDSFKVQGIVSLIDSHRLAVVTTENIVLDILTLEQQKTLEAYIRLELANYWYEKRQQLQLQRKIPGLIPSFSKTRPNVLPPVRWFWQIMRWEQTSDIAKEINLFGESSLVWVEPLPSDFIAPLLTLLDGKLAMIEEKDLISLTQWLQRTLTQSPSDLSKSPAWKIQLLIRAAVDYFFGSKQQEISTSEKPLTLPGTASGQKILESIKETGVHWLYTIGDRINEHLPDTTTNPEANPFKIQVLIKSALSYYLAKEESLLTPQDTPQILAASSEPTEQDPWLTWYDLFTPTAEINQSSLEIPPQPITALPPASTIPTKLNNSLQPKLKQENKPKAIRKVAPKPQSIVPVAVHSTPVDTKKPEKIVNQPFPTSYESDINRDWPDWVETKATSTGYEKHILERILDWFDQIVLWVEELIIKVWHWLRVKKRNRKRNQR